jgi:hypothetical protein
MQWGCCLIYKFILPFFKRHKKGTKMKKAGLLIIFSFVLLSFLTYGCTNRDYDTGVWTMPTFTPLPSGIIVGANIMYTPSSSFGTIVLATTGGNPVSGATVTINGQPFLEASAGSGVYMNTTLTGITTGTVLNLVVTSTSGNATGTATIPMTTGTNAGTFTGAAAGSTFAASCP